MVNKKLDSKTIVLIFAFLFLLVTVFNINFVSSQETLYCAEKTVDGAWCQNVPQEECAEGYECERFSCESTTYCSTGTCVNRVTGECLPATKTTCESSQGGFFDEREKNEVPECQIGCCILGEEVSLIERTKCDAVGRDFNVKAEFRPDISEEAVCLAMASPEAKGACTFETELGTDCDFTTKEQCQNEGKDFNEGLLCTNPDLGTICSMTKRTTCVEGKNEIFFVDSCGNLANVYDANKVEDVNYWSYIPGVEGVEVDLGDGRGNIDSRIYGACDYLEGSTCGPGNAEYGNNVCVSLGCEADELTGGIPREHGEGWCSESLDNFGDAEPGKLSYLLYCYDGEVQYELCDPFRNKLCNENPETGNAACIANRWTDCTLQENTRDCLDTSKRDCKIVEDASSITLRTEYGTEKQILDSDTGEFITGTCVPKYIPGFKFWDSEGTLLSSQAQAEDISSICNFASVSCFVPYTQEIIGVTKWRKTPSDECINACEKERSAGALDFSRQRDCYEECTPVCLEDLDGKDKDTNARIIGEWAEGYQNLCVSLGDCGVSGNYIGREGYNRWRDLFTGEQIDWRTLPGADDKK